MREKYEGKGKTRARRRQSAAVAVAYVGWAVTGTPRARRRRPDRRNRVVRTYVPQPRTTVRRVRFAVSVRSRLFAVAHRTNVVGIIINYLFSQRYISRSNFLFNFFVVSLLYYTPNKCVRFIVTHAVRVRDVVIVCPFARRRRRLFRECESASDYDFFPPSVTVRGRNEFKIISPIPSPYSEYFVRSNITHIILFYSHSLSGHKRLFYSSRARTYFK